MIPILVQCRLGSQRLPCKVIYPVNGKPLIRYMYERLLKCKNASHVMFVCPEKDYPVIAAANVPVWGEDGEEEDVYGRLLGVLNNHEEIREAKWFVRLCADSPLIDPAIVDQVINARESFPEHTVAIVTNTMPRTWPDGQCVEAIETKLFRYPGRSGKDVNGDCKLLISDLEHVTPWFYRHMPEHIQNVSNVAGDFSGKKLTVDTMEDFQRVRRVIEEMTGDHTEYGWRECLELMS